MSRITTMLTEQEEQNIRETLARGDVQGKDLAAQYGVSPMVISNIKTGKRKNRGKKGPAKLTAEIAITIKHDLKSGVQAKVLARRYNIHLATISKIKLGQRWGEVQ